MGPEIVTVSAGGSTWSAFEKVDVTAGANEAARSFNLQIAAANGGSGTVWVFGCGTPLTISSNGDLLVTGYVDRYKPKLEDKGTAQIHVSGRSKGQDAIDSSAVHPTGHFDNQTVLQIAQQLDKFGIGFSTDQMLQPIPSYQIVPGETVFRLLERLCRQQGLVMTGQPDGSIKFTKTAPGMHAALIEGINCKGLEADHNWAGRHSHVIARGQRASGVGTSSLQIEQLAQDSAVNRYRPVVMVVDGDTDPQRAQQAAKWRQAREAGHSLKATIRVQSFRDDGGTLWTPGNLVPVDSDFLGIQGVMAVERVHWSQSRAAGSVSTLSLCDPRALGGEGGGSAPGGSTNSVWDIGDDSGE